MHKNILTVVGITILFLGLAIQPSIAVNPITSDNEDDCSICPKVSKLQVVRLKRLKDKLEINKGLKPYISGAKSICEFLYRIMKRFEPLGAIIEDLYYNSEHNPISLQFFIACLGVAVINLFWMPLCFLFFIVFDCY
jgi:hypothetical protein